jgi:large subunit ribosomal protein L5
MAKTEKQMPRFQERYEKKLKAALKTKYGIKNDLAIPRLDKIVINMGVGEATTDRKAVEAAANELALLSGQRPVITKAKKSNASFKVRENMDIGCKVTLRREKMYEFMDRLVTIALPRIHIVFPEIDYDKVGAIRGMDIIICTTAANDEQAKELLRGFDMPFRN